jgi:hypothetical protein
MAGLKTGIGAASVALMLCLPQSVFAENHVVREYVVEGPGRMTCADFNAAEAAEPRIISVASWLNGYLTAHNRLSNDIFDLTPWQTTPILMSLLAQYCAANPDQIVERGAQELVAYLVPNALREPSDVVAVGQGSDVVLLYVRTVGNIRQRLSEEGFPPATSMESLLEAIAAFQAQNGLPVTGLPSQNTLAILLR